MAKATRKKLTPSQKIAALRLIRSENVGPVTFHQLIRRTGSAEAALAELPRLATRVGIGTRIPSLAEAEGEIAALEKLGGRLVASDEPDYPPLLHHISAAPPLISVVGGERLDLGRTIAIVGARNASAAGQRIRLVTSAEDIIETLAQADPSRANLLEPDWEPDLAENVTDAEPTTGDRSKLLDGLSLTPTPVDRLIAATGLSVAVVQTLLLELDLAGRIEWSSGQLVALRP